MSVGAAKSVETMPGARMDARGERRSGEETALDTRAAMLALQKSAGNQAVTSLIEEQRGIPAPLRRAAESSRGEKLPDRVAAMFSDKFGRDLSDVEIHRDAAASDAVRGIGANAFAWGGDLFFRDGEYQPDDPSGQALLAHELAHVIQQTGSSGASSAGPSTSEAHARNASADQQQGSAALDAGPAAPVGVAADNGVSYEDEERGMSVLSTRDEAVDTILDKEAEADRRRAESGVTDAETGRLDEQAMALRDTVSVSAAEQGKSTGEEPKMPVSSPDLRNAPAEEIQAHRREVLEAQLASKNPQDQELLARDMENTNLMAAGKRYNIVIAGAGAFDLQPDQASALVRRMLVDLSSDTEALEQDVNRAHDLRESTSSWVTGPVHFWGGAWDEIEITEFGEANRLRVSAEAALKSGKIDEAIDLLRDSYYEYQSLTERFGEYQEGIQKGGGRMIKMLSTVENVSKGVISSWNPLAGFAYSFGVDEVQQKEMVNMGLLDKVDHWGNFKGGVFNAVLGKATGGVSGWASGATKPFVGSLASQGLGFASGIGVTSLATWTNPLDVAADPTMALTMLVSHGLGVGRTTTGGGPQEQVSTSDFEGSSAPEALQEASRAQAAHEQAPPAGLATAPEALSPGGSTSAAAEPSTPASASASQAPQSAANVSQAPQEQLSTAAPQEPEATQGGSGGGDGPSGGGGQQAGQPAPPTDMRGEVMADGTIRIRGEAEPGAPTDVRGEVMADGTIRVRSEAEGGEPAPTDMRGELMPDGRIRIRGAGEVNRAPTRRIKPPRGRRRNRRRGIGRWFPSLNIDEPQAVGEPEIGTQESMRRAMDLTNRQFLDFMTNQGTKREFKEVPSSARGTPDLSPVSVADNPAALITRPSLGGVKEWDALSKNIMTEKGPSLQGKSPKQVKEILNRAIREEIKNPKTPEGKAISDALSKMFGVPAGDLFRKRRVPIRPAAGAQPTDMSAEPIPEGIDVMPDGSIRIAGDMRGEEMPDGGVRIRGEDESGEPAPPDMRGETIPDGRVRIRGEEEAGNVPSKGPAGKPPGAGKPPRTAKPKKGGAPSKPARVAKPKKGGKPSKPARAAKPKKGGAPSKPAPAAKPKKGGPSKPAPAGKPKRGGTPNKPAPAAKPKKPAVRRRKP